jgi:hypothetical protein
MFLLSVTYVPHELIKIGKQSNWIIDFDEKYNLQVDVYF